MSTESMGVAAKSLKQAQQEMVQWENTLEGLENKVKALVKQKDDIQATIDKKLADFETTISFKRTDYVKREAALEEEKRKVSLAKEELEKAVKVLATERAAIQKDRDTVDVLKKVFEERNGKIDQFVIALQRAYTLVG